MAGADREQADTAAPPPGTDPREGVKVERAAPAAKK